MKKSLMRTMSIFLVVIMVFASVACGSGKSGETQGNAESKSGTQETKKAEPDSSTDGLPSENGGTDSSQSVQNGGEADGGPVYGGVLYMSREGTQTETSLYPHTAVNSLVAISMSPAIERLFYFDGDGTMVPQLAESWDVSEDNLVYTFHLAKGVKFHDGSDFNADVAMWNLQQGKDNAAETNCTNASITSMKAIDDYTLEVAFETMNALMFVSFDCWMFSKQAFEENGVEWCQTHPVGTGPFVFDHWTYDSELVYTRNDNYRIPEQPYLDGVTFKIIKDNTVLAASMQNKEIDCITGAGSVDLVEALDAQEDVVQLVTKNPSGAMSWMPCGLETSPLNDTTVRKALAYAIDFDAIVSSTMDPKVHQASNQMAMPGSPWYSENVVSYDYDPVKARELLKEAGYGEGGEKLHVELVTESSPVFRSMSEAMQAYLLDVGIDCEINVMEAAAYFENVITKPWEDDWIVHMGSGYTAYIPLTPADRLMGANHAKMLGSVFFPDEWVDNIVSAAAQPTLEEAMPYFKKASEAFFNDYCGFVAIRVSYSPVYVRNTVENYNIDDTVTQYGSIWKSGQ